MRVLTILLFCISLFAESRYIDLFSSPLDLTTADSTELAVLIDSISGIKELQAQFTQKKTIRSLSKSLLSSGELYFYSDSILIWLQKKPFEEKISIDPDGHITITDDLGAVREENRNNRMNGVFSALFSGEFRTLDQLFEIYLEKQSDQWVLGLIPKRAAMKKGMESIVVCCRFSGFISKLVLTSPHGETCIDFTTEMR